MIIKDINKKIHNTPDNINEELAPISEEHIRNLFKDVPGDESNPLDYYTKIQTDAKIREINNSIGAVSDSVTAVEGRLEETNQSVSNINSNLSLSDNTKYVTINGVKELECKDEYIDNVVIEGETLVNLCNPSEIQVGGQAVVKNDGAITCTSTENQFSMVRIYTPERLKPNTQYTLIYNITKNTFPTDGRAIGINVSIDSEKSAIIEDIFHNGGETGLFKRLVNTRSDFTGINCRLRAFFDNRTKAVGLQGEMYIMLVEGDFVSKNIPYFKDLCSVGQGDKMQILTYQNNRNCKIDLSSVVWKDNHYLSYDNNEVSHIGYCYSENYISIDKVNDVLVLENCNPHITFYDVNKQYIPQGLGWFVGGGDKLTITNIPINAKYFRFTSEISKRGTEVIYQSKWDKKQILTTLRSVPNIVKDTLHNIGGKYCKTEKCTEFIVNGNIPITSFYEVPDSNILRIAFDITQFKLGGKEYSAFISDKISFEINFDNKKPNYGFISDGGKYMWLFFDKSVVTQQNYKEYLNSNPIRFVAQKDPTTIEIPNFNPRTFEGSTILLVNSGVIQSEATFEVTNSLGSSLDVVHSKVSDIDNSISSMQKIHYSKVEPTSDQGKDGDLWIIYKE